MADEQAAVGERIFLGLGSNIEPEVNTRRALLALAQRMRLVAVSTFYATEPIGRPEQAMFLNGVVQVTTDTPPWALKYEEMRAVEEELGRQRTADRYAARTIDLDLLLYDDLVIDRPGLRIPDPDILARDFVAIPLYELAPNLVLPGWGRSLREVVEAFADHEMRPCLSYTEALRRELGLT